MRLTAGLTKGDLGALGRTMMALINYGRYDTIKPSEWPWRYFTPYEMRQRENDIVIVDPEFMELLTKLRVAYARPMVVTSYYRSPEYNQRVSSSGRSGPHTTGRAVDIKVNGYEAAVLTAKAVQIGFTGFGWSQKGDHGRRFLHLDTLAARSWSY